MEAATLNEYGSLIREAVTAGRQSPQQVIYTALHGAMGVVLGAINEIEDAIALRERDGKKFDREWTNLRMAKERLNRALKAVSEIVEANRPPEQHRGAARTRDKRV